MLNFGNDSSVGEPDSEGYFDSEDEHDEHDDLWDPMPGQD